MKLTLSNPNPNPSETPLLRSGVSNHRLNKYSAAIINQRKHIRLLEATTAPMATASRLSIFGGLIVVRQSAA